MYTPTVRSNVDLFARAQSDMISIASQYVPYYLQNDLDNELALLEIQISGTLQNYLDLKNSFAHVKAKVIRADGTAINNFFNGELSRKAADWTETNKKMEYPPDQISPVNLWP